MQRLLTAASLATIALAISLTPAAAKSKKYHHRVYQQYSEPQAWNGGWTTRNVSDPSFGNRTGLNYARRTGRCVEDLGYGRFEYCGW